MTGSRWWGWGMWILGLCVIGLAGCVTMDRPGADAITKQDDELRCRQLAALRAGPEGGLFRETILLAELKKCLQERGWVVTQR